MGGPMQQQVPVGHPSAYSSGHPSREQWPTRWRAPEGVEVKVNYWSGRLNEQLQINVTIMGPSCNNLLTNSWRLVLGWHRQLLLGDSYIGVLLLNSGPLILGPLILGLHNSFIQLATYQLQVYLDVNSQLIYRQNSYLPGSFIFQKYFEKALKSAPLKSQTRKSPIKFANLHLNVRKWTSPRLPPQEALFVHLCVIFVQFQAIFGRLSSYIPDFYFQVLNINFNLK